jgi:broad-specificity NMP kinase
MKGIEPGGATTPRSAARFTAAVGPTGTAPKSAARNGETTMSRVLLTGMSGTGKSSVIAELKRRGFAAIDMDEPGWSVRDDEGHQLWCEERLREVLAAEHAGPVFVSGCAENQVRFYPWFNYIILLSAPADVIRERLATRTNNSYGKGAEELGEVLHYLEVIEPLLRRKATHEIETTVPLQQVVETVLCLVNAQPSKGGTHREPNSRCTRPRDLGA